MKDFKKHPNLTNAEDLREICKPLEQLNITYFGHAKIDQKDKFSALALNPKFAKHYLENKYYNADIHLAKEENLGKYILWDALEVDGKANKMSQEAAEMGIRHTFTIIKESLDEKNFYHFATHLHDKFMSQVYLSNFDVLNKFIEYFNEKVSKSKELSKAYDLKFSIDTEHSEFKIININNFVEIQQKRLEMIKVLTSEDDADHQCSIQDKESQKIIYITLQQFKCFDLLSQGYSIKKIGKITHLSPRTVEHYLRALRKKLDCKTGRELIAQYSKLKD